MTTLLIPMIGAGGEPVDFARTIHSHGVTSLPPMEVDAEACRLSATISVEGHLPRRVVVDSPAPETCRITVAGETPDAAEAERIQAAVRHILRLDDDLSGFYALAAKDPALAWVIRGAGRMTRGQTVFEDVVKTICTTNCAWSATVRMVTALVFHLGQPSADAHDEDWRGRAFPEPAALADAEDAFYRDHARCGYRGAYLRKLASMVVDGEIDLEGLATTSDLTMSDLEMEKFLISLPGVGPYAAAHIMTMLGRYSRQVFDSFTRPKYARLMGRESVPDGEIVERFSGYGRYAGLAFWLTITADWLET